MTGLILAGFGVTIANIVFTNQSKCNKTSLGKISTANAVIFFILASLVLIFCHTTIWIPICKNICGKRGSGAVAPNS